MRVEGFRMKCGGEGWGRGLKGVGEGFNVQTDRQTLFGVILI